MMADHDISTLIEVSRRYGADARMVLLGGGNTSWKTDSVMYVKASGHALGTIGRDGFVAMSMDRLQAIWDKQYPTVPEQREKQILEDMMESRLCGREWPAERGSLAARTDPLRLCGPSPPCHRQRAYLRPKRRGVYAPALPRCDLDSVGEPRIHSREEGQGCDGRLPGEP